MHLPTLTVIIPNYNHAGYLQKVLEDICSQSFRPTEVIVIDDGSTDNSVEVIERFIENHPLVRLYCNEQNKGVIFSANRAVQLASGEYIYFAAADDLILGGFFERSMGLLSRYPGAGLCSAIVEAWEADGMRIRPSLKHLPQEDSYLGPDECLRLLRRRDNWMGSNSTIFRRSAFVEAGGVNSDLGPSCDTFLEMVIAAKWGVCYVPMCLTVRRLHASSYSASFRADIDKTIKMYSESARLLRTTYKEQFSEDFVKSWETREVNRARLSSLHHIRRQETAIVKSLLRKRSVIDWLFSRGLTVAGHFKVFVIVAYLFLTGDKELRNAIITLTQIAIQRTKQRIKSLRNNRNLSGRKVRGVNSSYQQKF